MDVSPEAGGRGEKGSTCVLPFFVVRLFGDSQPVFLPPPPISHAPALGAGAPGWHQSDHLASGAHKPVTTSSGYPATRTVGTGS